MSEPFDFDHYLSIPRLSALRISPDGSRLAVTVASPAPDGKNMRSAVWGIDPAGARRPGRLTASAAGESDARFLPDGGLVFTSARPDPDAKPDDKDPPAGIWLLPGDGGEARLLLAPPAGASGLHVAAAAGTIVFTTGMHPTARSLEDDRDRDTARTDAGVRAILFESYPIQFWDHYLGPREIRVFAVDPPVADGRPRGEPADLSGPAGASLADTTVDVAPDGSAVVVAWRRWTTGHVGDDLVLIDRSTGDRRVLTGGRDWYGDQAFSPDGLTIAAVHGTDGSPDVAVENRLVLIDVATGAARDPAPSLDVWPHGPTWAPDGSAVYFLGEDHGTVAVWRVDIADDRITRLAADGSYSDLCPSPDGAAVFALRSSPDRPPHPVRLDSRSADQIGVELPFPGLSEAELPRRGVLERLRAVADDGHPIESWLVRPADASAANPAPLVVFVHGGPVGSWSGWSWRWNANLLVERGYAVLMPDPAISLGYGQAHVQRGWGRWHERPYTDVIAAVDGAAGRPDIDERRTGLMGGSFGGYMANWVAGHTDRFRAIVTHASLWDLRGFHGTTDDGVWWEQEFGDPYLDPSRYHEQSPSAHVAAIRTPMLVIHGELDARVPISEALRLWTDLHRHDVEAKFLYFPDENHWVLKPQNARLWYETVLAFLDHHLLGRDWVRPGLV